MTPDEKFLMRQSIVNEVVDEVKEKITPAPETLRFMQQQNEINKVVQEKLDEIKDIAVEARNHAKIAAEQSTKTNGRVGKLEQWHSNNDSKISTLFEEKKEWRQGWKAFLFKSLDILSKLAVAALAAWIGLNHI